MASAASLMRTRARVVGRERRAVLELDLGGLRERETRGQARPRGRRRRGVPNWRRVRSKLMAVSPDGCRDGARGVRSADSARQQRGHAALAQGREMRGQPRGEAPRPRRVAEHAAHAPSAASHGVGARRRPRAGARPARRRPGSLMVSAAPLSLRSRRQVVQPARPARARACGRSMPAARLSRNAGSQRTGTFCVPSIAICCVRCASAGFSKRRSSSSQ